MDGLRDLSMDDMAEIGIEEKVAKLIADALKGNVTNVVKGSEKGSNRMSAGQTSEMTMPVAGLSSLVETY